MSLHPHNLPILLDLSLADDGMLISLLAFLKEVSPCSKIMSYRSKRSRTALGSKAKDTTVQSVQDTIAQVNHDVTQVPDTLLNSSSNQSMTADPSPTQPLEADTPCGLRSSQRRSFQVEDTGFHPIHGTTKGTFGSETQVSAYYDQWTDDPIMTEPMQNTTTEANDVRPNQGNAAGRQSLAPSPTQTLDAESLQQFKPSKKHSVWVQEDDGEPAHKVFSDARPTKPSKWSDVIQFDEMEEVEMRDSKGRCGRKRGKIFPRHVWSLQPGVRFVVPFNELDQPVRKGGYVLIRFLGDIARNGELCPIGEINWHKVDKSLKADIIVLLHEKFVLPPHEENNKSMLKHVGNKWRNYRHELKGLYKKPDKTLEQVASVVPKGVVPSQWKKLVEYWFSDKCEFYSTKGKEARAALSHVHTAGSKSFARMRDEFEKTHGREPGALEWFVQTHQRKDGTYVEKTSKEFLDTAAAMISQRAPTSSSQRVDMENEVFNELMYSDEERVERPIGYGFGVNKNKVSGVEGELRRRGYLPSRTSVGAGNVLQSQILGVRKRSSYASADTSPAAESLSFAMAAMTETNGLMQAQLKMQSMQLKKQSEQLKMQSKQMEAVQLQLQQVTSLLTKFGVKLNNPQTNFARQGINFADTHRQGINFANTQVLENSDESSDGESESSEWDSE